MSRFWIDKISSVKPYVPGEQPTSDTLIKLNTNEHALLPSDSVLAAIKSTSGEALRRYPDPGAAGLRAAIAALSQCLQSEFLWATVPTRCWRISGLLS